MKTKGVFGSHCVAVLWEKLGKRSTPRTNMNVRDRSEARQPAVSLGVSQ